MRSKFIIIVAVCLFSSSIIAGCQGHNSSNPLLPLPEHSSTASFDSGNHLMWGLYQFYGDMLQGTVEVIPLRGVDIHLNTLAFLEPPPMQYLWVDGPIKINGTQLDLTIALKHPFYGHNEYTGFDVKGIMIANGHQANYLSTQINMASKDEIRLINADGYTRWWAPVYFENHSAMPVKNYTDGLLGTPNSEAQFLASINPYKYFCDDLGPDDDVSQMDLSKRGMFTSTKVNKRRYLINVPTDEFVFNYAVDASWAQPSTMPVVNLPDDFPLSANQLEGFHIDVEQVSNTIYYDGEYGGGGLSLNITVYQWRPASTIRRVFFEGATVIAPHDSLAPIAEGSGWAKYNVHTSFAAPISTDPIDLIIGVESNIDIADLETYELKPTVFIDYEVTVGTSAPPGTPGTLKGIRMNPIEPNPLPVDYPKPEVRDWHQVLEYEDCNYYESVDGGKTWQFYPDAFLPEAADKNCRSIDIGFDHRLYFLFSGDLLAIESAPGSHEFSFCDLSDDPVVNALNDDGANKVLCGPDGIIYLFELHDKTIKMVFSADGGKFYGPYKIIDDCDTIYYKCPFWLEIAIDNTLFCAYQDTSGDYVLKRGSIGEGMLEPTFLPTEYLHGGEIGYPYHEGFHLSNDMHRVLICVRHGPDDFPDMPDGNWGGVNYSLSYNWGESFPKFSTSSRTCGFRLWDIELWHYFSTLLPDNGMISLSRSRALDKPWWDIIPVDIRYMLSYSPDGTEWSHTYLEAYNGDELDMHATGWTNGFSQVRGDYLITADYSWY